MRWPNRQPSPREFPNDCFDFTCSAIAHVNVCGAADKSLPVCLLPDQGPKSPAAPKSRAILTTFHPEATDTVQIFLLLNGFF
jgi:hypothetical protein